LLADAITQVPPLEQGEEKQGEKSGAVDATENGERQMIKEYGTEESRKEMGDSY
jgi:hypothetical protein